jgi:uncharacterized membrane protein
MNNDVVLSKDQKINGGVLAFFWIASIGLLISYGVGLILFPPSLSGEEIKVSDWVLFIGRFHPILVHMPVGAFTLLMGLEMLCWSKRMEAQLGLTALLVSFFGGAGSVATVIAGIMLSREGIGGPSFNVHLIFGVIGTFGVLIALMIRVLGMKCESRKLLGVGRLIFFGAYGLMSLGAHFGANLVHGDKYMIQYAPPAIRESVKGFESGLLSYFKTEPKKAPVVEEVVAVHQAVDPIVYSQVLAPIFEEKCNYCHNADKTKGDLNMTALADLFKGGENGAALVASKPDESLALVRILLPVDDDEHMPSDNKHEFVPEEIEVFKSWILAGAKEELKLSELTLSEKTQQFIKIKLK